MIDKAAVRTRGDVTLASCSPPTLAKQHVMKLEAAAPGLLDACRMWVCQTTQAHLATGCVPGMCGAKLSTPHCLPLLGHATGPQCPLEFTLCV